MQCLWQQCLRTQGQSRRLQQQSEKQLNIFAFLIFIVFLNTVVTWPKNQCSFIYNLWPLFTMLYFLGIRIYEINHLNGMIEVSRQVKIVIAAVFLPTYLGLTIYGFVLFFQAQKSKCLPTSTDGDFIYFSVLILSMVRTFILAMLSIFILTYQVRIRGLNRTRSPESTLITQAQQRQQNGLTRHEISQIESQEVTRRNSGQYCNLSCSICLTDFAKRDHIKILGCGHTFHEKCITKWLERSTDCPNCKQHAINSRRSSSIESSEIVEEH